MHKALIASFLLIGATWMPTPVVAEDEDTDKPVMVDADNGWWQRSNDARTQTLHTTDGGKHWVDVSPAVLTDAVQKLPKPREDPNPLSAYVVLTALNAQSARVVYTFDGKTVMTESMADTGQHWRQQTAAASTGEEIFANFVDEEHGFLLTMGGAHMGMHVKRVYGTTNGGKTWHPLTEPPGNSFITTGIVFRNAKEGWITGEYRGSDDRVLCHTTDGGKIWKRQTFKLPGADKISYTNIYPPVFAGAEKRQGYLPVKIIRNEPSPRTVAWVNYETDDGGATWHVPASGIHYAQDDD